MGLGLYEGARRQPFVPYEVWNRQHVTMWHFDLTFAGLNQLLCAFILSCMASFLLVHNHVCANTCEHTGAHACVRTCTRTHCTHARTDAPTRLSESPGGLDKHHLTSPRFAFHILLMTTPGYNSLTHGLATTFWGSAV